MCVGENCARQAVRYVNAQLSAHYENALDCIGNHNQYQKSTETDRYSHALADFTYYSTKKQPLFQATFEKPRLEFICNHDAILRLHIKSVNYCLDESNTSVINYAGKDRVESLINLELSFCVPFSTRSLDSEGVRYNNGHNPLHLIVLDFTEARLLSAESIAGVGRDSFARYLKEYLLFLAAAGNHVFLSLPGSDDAGCSLTIDYSTLEDADHTVLEIGDMYGVSVEKINEYLSSAWLKAKLVSDESSDWKSFCLSEYSSTNGLLPGWDVLFRVRLRAPRLKPLCSQEAIIYFGVDEVLFYEDADFTKTPSHTYSGWQIAVLVNIVHQFDGSVTRCTLDLGSARPAPAHCTHIRFVNEEEEFHWFRMVEFFSSAYLQILESVGLHVVYFSDSRWPIAAPSFLPSDEEETEDEEFFETISEEEGTIGKSNNPVVTEWRKTIREFSTSGFDQIIVTSQSAINSSFRLLWKGGQAQRHKDHALVEWRYEEFFIVRWQPMTLRLLSNGRAIIWMHLEYGDFKLLRGHEPSQESELYHFEGWHLAFEVNLRKVTYDELDPSEPWIARYQDSSVYREYGKRADCSLEYILLDLDNPEFLYEFSSFAGLFHQAGETRERPSSADQVLAVVHYLRSYYLPHLSRSGFNIIQVIPVRKPDTGPASVPLTVIQYHVCSKETITRTNWAHASGNSEPVIVVIGMTEFRPLPASRLEYTSSLISRAPGSTSCGNVSISRSTFLDKCLLELLGTLNARTTLIPLSSGFVDGRLELHITTWARDERRKEQVCRWQEARDEAADIMVYKWERHDDWDTGETDHINYSVSCATRNLVQLPIAARTKSLDIKISGETKLAMSFKSATQQGSSQATARWQATISIQSGFDGLKVKDIEPFVPVVEPPVVVIEPPAASNASDTLPDLRAKLYELLPETIDLSKVLSKLKAFEGAWRYSYLGLHAYCLAHPVFNRKGDVIFELRPQGQGVFSSRRILNGDAGSIINLRGQASRMSRAFASQTTGVSPGGRSTPDRGSKLQISRGPTDRANPLSGGQPTNGSGESSASEDAKKEATKVEDVEKRDADGATEGETPTPEKATDDGVKDPGRSNEDL